MTDNPGFATRCVHGAGGPDPATGAVVPPIHLATTYAQSEVGRHKGFEYSRTANPTRTALERHLATLEGATHGFAFASGMAAEDAVLRLLSTGEHLVMPDDAYGGTYRLARRIHEPMGVRVSAIDLTDLVAVEGALDAATGVVWIESPTNPMLRIVDIEAVARLAHGFGALVVVDNTFATPALQRPLELGADIVVHSTTKYLGGHSDVVGGFVATNDDDAAEHLGFVQNAAGAVPSPFDCYLVHRGARTLHLRMARHTENARAVVDLLAEHPAVAEVLWPGFGGMVSFRLRGGEAAAMSVCATTRLFTLAESLGAVESLIEHPGRMTHLSVAGTSNEVPADLVRLSVGIEDAVDLVADLRQALDSVA